MLSLAVQIKVFVIATLLASLISSRQANAASDAATQSQSTVIRGHLTKVDQCSSCLDLKKTLNRCAKECSIFGKLQSLFFQAKNRLGKCSKVGPIAIEHDRTTQMVKCENNTQFNQHIDFSDGQVDYMYWDPKESPSNRKNFDKFVHDFNEHYRNYLKNYDEKILKNFRKNIKTKSIKLSKTDFKSRIIDPPTNYRYAAGGKPYGKVTLDSKLNLHMAIPLTSGIFSGYPRLQDQICSQNKSFIFSGNPSQLIHWSPPLKINPLCEESYHPGEVDITLYYRNDSPHPVIEVVTNAPACVPNYVYGFDVKDKVYKLADFFCSG
jgi:hypothetical protein